MDIDLLSKMVKELILDNDRVGLPGMGAFVAQMVPSSFSDKGYMIHPPYRRLSFRAGESEDSLLAGLYAKSNAVDGKVAEGIIKDFISELKDYLKTNRVVIFPGLGKLRSTRENICFFICDEDLDIWPAGAGMEPVSLKSHQDQPAPSLASIGAEFLSAAVPESEPEEKGPDNGLELDQKTDLRPESEFGIGTGREDVPEFEDKPESVLEPEPELKSESESKPESEPEPESDSYLESDPKPEPIIEPEPDSSQEPGPSALPSEAVPENSRLDEDSCCVTDYRPPKPRVWRTFSVIILTLFAVFALFLAIFVIVAHFCPDFIDKFLYSAEELSIINYGK